MYADIKVLITSVPIVFLTMLVSFLVEIYFDRTWPETLMTWLLPTYFVYIAAEVTWCVFRGLWL